MVERQPAPSNSYPPRSLAQARRDYHHMHGERGQPGAIPAVTGLAAQRSVAHVAQPAGMSTDTAAPNAPDPTHIDERELARRTKRLTHARRLVPQGGRAQSVQSGAPAGRPSRPRAMFPLGVQPRAQMRLTLLPLWNPAHFTWSMRIRARWSIAECSAMQRNRCRS